MLIERKDELGKKLKSFFSDLEFNESEHRYTVNNKNLISVSHKIKKFVVPFDSELNAQRIALRDGKTIEEVLKSWEDIAKKSCELGTKVHLFGENYTGVETPTNGYEEAIVKFFNLLPPHLKLVCNELQMYSEDFNIAGTADLIFLNSNTNKLVIGDFKTNKDLFKNFKGQTLLNPFEDILDSPYGKYILQLSYYHLLLEQTGYKVEDRMLIWLKPNGVFSAYRTPDVTKRLLDDLIRNKRNKNV